jgi:hypothetical protein
MMSDDMDSRLRLVEKQIDTHEAVCAERYNGILKSTEIMQKDFGRLSNLLIRVGLVLMVGMAGILTKLVFHP